MDRWGKTLFLLIASAIWLLSLGGCSAMIASTAQVADTAAPSQGASQTSPAGLPAASGPMQISGLVLSGGDTTPKGLMDAPRKFAYEVQMENGQKVTLQYTAFPPSPARDRSAIQLKFHAGQIQVGDYLVASGTYDAKTNTLVIQQKGDSVETYSKKP
jgi:hypothetical protein